MIFLRNILVGKINIIQKIMKNSWKGCLGFLKKVVSFVRKTSCCFLDGKPRRTLLLASSLDQANIFFESFLDVSVDLGGLEDDGFCWVEQNGIYWCVVLCQRDESLSLLRGGVHVDLFHNVFYLVEYKDFHGDEAVGCCADKLLSFFGRNKLKLNNSEWHLCFLGLEKLRGFHALAGFLNDQKKEGDFFLTRLDPKDLSDARCQRFSGLVNGLRESILLAEDFKQAELYRLLFSFCCVYSKVLAGVNELIDLCLKDKSPVAFGSLSFFSSEKNASVNGFGRDRQQKLIKSIVGKVERGFFKKARMKVVFTCFGCCMLCLIWLVFLGHEKSRALFLQNSILKNNRQIAGMLVYGDDGLTDYHQRLVDIYTSYNGKEKDFNFLIGNNDLIAQGRRNFLDNLVKVINYFVQSEVVDHVKNKLSFYHHQWGGFPKKRNVIRGDYYHYLKSYMMLWFPDHACLDCLARFFSNIWFEDNFMSASNVGDRLINNNHTDNMMRFYLKYIFSNHSISDLSLSEPNALEASVIKQARKDLAVDDNIVNDFYEKISFKDERYDLASILKNKSSYIVYPDRKIPYVYTHKGWQEYLKPWLHSIDHQYNDNLWVFGNDEKVRVSDADVGKLVTIYQQDYYKVWLSVVQNTTFKPFSNIENALQVLSKSTSASSDYFRLLNHFHQVFQLKFELKDFSADSIQVVDKHHRLGGFAQFVDKYRQQLLVLTQDLQQMQSGADQNKSVYIYCNKVFMGRAETSIVKLVSMVNAFSAGQPLVAQKAYRHLLLMPVVSVWRLILQDTALYIDDQWKNLIYQNYIQELQDDFPVDVSAVRGVSLNDMTSWFNASSGKLYYFYQQYLQNITDESDDNLILKSWLGFSVPIKAGSLKQISYLLLFSKSLFFDKSMGFSYRVDPAPERRVESVVFFDGLNTFSYDNGFLKGYDFKYTANSRQGSYIRIKSLPGGFMHEKTMDGPHAFLRLLYKADWQKISKNSYRLCWHLNHSRYCFAAVNLSGDVVSVLSVWQKKGLVFPAALIDRAP